MDCMCVFVCVLLQMGVDERLLSRAVNVIYAGINRQASLPIADRGAVISPLPSPNH